MNTSVIHNLMVTLGILVLVIVGSTSAVFLLLLGINAYLNRQEQKRRERLKGYTFPASCYLEVQQRYPHLTSEQVALAVEQLRLYFEVCLVYSSPSSSSPIAMPSKLVDYCWHAFICETREYEVFCKSIFGSFLHHESKPNSSFPLVHIAADDLKEIEGKASLKEEQLQQVQDFKNQLSAAMTYQWTLSLSKSQSGSRPLQVPELFSIDQDFHIEDGYVYTFEVLEFLAKFDLKAAKTILTKRETDAAGGSAVGCGDGGSCGGCGGSL